MKRFLDRTKKNMTVVGTALLPFIAPSPREVLNSVTGASVISSFFKRKPAIFGRNAKTHLEDFTKNIHSFSIFIEYKKDKLSKLKEYLNSYKIIGEKDRDRLKPYVDCAWNLAETISKENQTCQLAFLTFEPARKTLMEYERENKKIIEQIFETNSIHHSIKVITRCVAFIRHMRTIFNSQRRDLTDAATLILSLHNKKLESDERRLLGIIGNLEKSFSYEEKIYRELNIQSEQIVLEISSAISNFNRMKVDITKENAQQVGQVFGLISGLGLISWSLYSIFTYQISERSAKLIEYALANQQDVYAQLASRFTGFEEGFTLIVGFGIGAMITLVSGLKIAFRRANSA